MALQVLEFEFKSAATWEKMLGKFVTDTGVGNVSIEINDDNATPIVVYMRLRQALAEATAKEAE